MARTGEGMIRRSDDPIAFDLHHAMVRTVDGCVVPAIVRRDIDGGATNGKRGDRKPTFVRPL